MESKNWCEIFKTGKWTDKHGRVREYSEADLDKIVAGYDPKTGHEAPVCIDHNESAGPIKGGPAYGWVESLKRVGSSLYAKFREVLPGFARAVNDGFFTKRSAAFFSDGTLRHVAFLGAVPPAVKGMAPFEFQVSGDDDCLCYSEAVGDFKFSQEDIVTNEELQKQLDAEKAKSKAAEEQVTKLQTENQRLGAQFSEAEEKNLRTGLSAFVDTAIAEGRMLPAWKDAGIVEFMADLSKQPETYEFSEGKSQTALDWFKGFVTSFAAHPLFKQMAKPGKTDGSQFSDGDQHYVNMILNAGKPGKEAK